MPSVQDEKSPSTIIAAEAVTANKPKMCVSEMIVDFMLCVLGFGVVCAQAANDPKLSDRGARRGTCMVGGKVAVEAGAVTCGAVRCSAWLGVISVVDRRPARVRKNARTGLRRRNEDSSDAGIAWAYGATETVRQRRVKLSQRLDIRMFRLAIDVLLRNPNNGSSHWRPKQTA